MGSCLKSLQRPTHRYSHHYMLPLDAVSPSEGEEIYHRYQGGQPEQKPPQHFTCAGETAPPNFGINFNIFIAS